MKEDDVDEGLLKLLKESINKEEEAKKQVLDTEKNVEDEAFDEAFQMLLDYYDGYKVDDTLSPFFHED